MECRPLPLVLQASDGFLLIVPCMSDSPYHLWGQMIAVFTALHFALRGAPNTSSSSEVMSVPGVAGAPWGFQFVVIAQYSWSESIARMMIRNGYSSFIWVSKLEVRTRFPVKVKSISDQGTDYFSCRQRTQFGIVNAVHIVIATLGSEKT